jgi:hypothetical protein
MRWVNAIITLKVKHLAFGSGYLATRYGERISLTKTKNDANSGPGKAKIHLHAALRFSELCGPMPVPLTPSP